MKGRAETRICWFVLGQLAATVRLVALVSAEPTTTGRIQLARLEVKLDTVSISSRKELLPLLKAVNCLFLIVHSVPAPTDGNAHCSHYPHLPLLSHSSFRPVRLIQVPVDLRKEQQKQAQTRSVGLTRSGGARG